MIEPTVASYAAGVLDSDGCIQLCRKARRDYYYYSLSVSVTQVTESIPLWFQRNFGGNIFRYDASKGDRQSLIRWSIHCHKAVDFLQIVLPFLIEKQERAKLGMELQSSLKRMGNKRPDEEILKKRHSIFFQMKCLNAHHGRNRNVFEPEKIRNIDPIVKEN